MKKLCLLLIALLITLTAFAACDKEDTPVDAATTDGETTTAAATTATEPDATAPETTAPETESVETEPETEPAAPAKSLEFTPNGDGSCYVSGMGTYTDSKLVIPATSPEGWRVTEIGNHAFYECTNVTSIVIPDSVTVIRGYAFAGCTGLESVEIPDNVKTVEYFAFSDCTGLTDVTFGSGVESIGRAALLGCTALTEIKVDEANTVYRSRENCLVEVESKTLVVGCKSSKIPADGSVTSIEKWAFRDCIGLESVVIPQCVTSIDNEAFRGCSALASIEVEAGNAVYHSAGNCLIETASKTLFAGCKSSVIPTDGSVTTIGDNAFYDCTSLLDIVIPEGITSIGYRAFYGCTGLTSIETPVGVTTIADGAFYGCSSAVTVILGQGVTSIGRYSFSDCSALKSIVIPNTMKTIGDGAIRCCPELRNVYYTGTPEEWATVTAVHDKDDLVNATLHCNYVPEA